jgi:hypothetical protein
MTDLSKLVRPLVWVERDAQSMVAFCRVSGRAYNAVSEDDQVASEALNTASIIAALDDDAVAKIRADALREAADAINERGAHEEANFGLGRETQNFYRARDLVRALIDKEPQK